MSENAPTPPDPKADSATLDRILQRLEDRCKIASRNIDNLAALLSADGKAQLSIRANWAGNSLADVAEAVAEFRQWLTPAQSAPSRA